MMHSLEFKAMGCSMSAILDSPADKMPPILSQVPIWFEGWEQSLSRFRADSELNRLNQSAGTFVQVSDTLWDVFHAAIDAERVSDGRVTPAILDALVMAGYDRSFDRMSINPFDHVAIPISAWGRISPLSEVIVDEAARALCLPRGMKLDFGGIAKGWAAHETMMRLKEHGAALVNAGGDLAISGAQADGERWPIGVDDPFHAGASLDLTLMLDRCGVATSGRDYRRWLSGGQWNHHIIDPYTGRPAQTDVISATVIAPTAVDAEVAAKVALISGARSGLEWIESDSSLAGMLVLEDGQCLLSSHMQEYMWREV
jgi:thiamine biosynthesis lipoprotein